jgi:hypothetical protein
MRKIAMSFGAGCCLTLAWYSGYVMGLNNTPEPFTPAALEAANSEMTHAVPTTLSEPAPLRVREVVDLARAYEPEPAREPALAQGISPATFNELPPRDKMPYAQTFEEPIEIAPREVK